MLVMKQDISLVTGHYVNYWRANYIGYFRRNFVIGHDIMLVI